MDSFKGTIRSVQVLNAAFLGGFAGINLCFILLYIRVSLTERDVSMAHGILETFADFLMWSGALGSQMNLVLACVGACFLTLVPGAAAGIALNLRYGRRPAYRTISLLMQTISLFGMLCLALLFVS